MDINGILIVDKPEGFTSFDVIAKLRGVLKTRKIGHSGTLDPMATGVLPLFIGKSTKAISLISEKRKRYIATVKVGTSTDTLDITGTVIKEEKTDIELDDICKIINYFIGDIYQEPPMYSAIKVNGQKLCNLARKGKVIEREKRKIHINSIDILDFNYEKQTFVIDVVCSKGTYVRSLAYDICEKLGTFGCLTELRRLESDGFNIDESFTLEQIIKCVENKTIMNNIIDISSVFSDFSSIHLTEKDSLLFKNGVKLNIDKYRYIDSMFKVYDNNNEFIAIGFIDDDLKIRVKNFFKR